MQPGPLCPVTRGPVRPTTHTPMFPRGLLRPSMCRRVPHPEGEKGTGPIADVTLCVLSTPAPLGRLRKVRLWHDSRGASPAWYVSHVMVKALPSGSGRWFFPAECWLAAGRRDGRVERELACLHRGLGFQKAGDVRVPMGTPARTGAQSSRAQGTVGLGMSSGLRVWRTRGLRWAGPALRSCH